MITLIGAGAASTNSSQRALAEGGDWGPTLFLVCHHIAPQSVLGALQLAQAQSQDSLMRPAHLQPVIRQ